MSWTLFLYGLLPILVFAFADAFMDLKWAVGLAIACAFADIFITRHLIGEWDPVSVVALGLFVVLGVVSIKVEQSIYFKLQPVVMSVLLAGVVLFYQTAGGGLVHQYTPHLKAMLPPAQGAKLDLPEVIRMMNSMVNALIVVLLLHAGWVGVAAYRWSNRAWLLARAIGFWILLLLILGGQMLLMNLRHA